MMEDHQFCDHCPGCRPAMPNPKTGRPVPHDDPAMVKVNQVRDNQTTYDQHKAFIEVTLHNSRNHNDLRLAQEVVKMIEEALKK